MKRRAEDDTRDQDWKRARRPESDRRAPMVNAASSTAATRPTGPRAGLQQSGKPHAAPVTVRLLTTEKETDPHRLAQRQKQIDYGKNTLGYDRYCTLVPRNQRRKGDPQTPNKTSMVSKKAFDGMIRKWRQALHKYDPPELQKAAQSADQGGEIAATSETRRSEVTTSPKDDDAMQMQEDLDELDPDRQPAHSIYENFDDDDDLVAAVDNDSDDDLL